MASKLYDREYWESREIHRKVIIKNLEKFLENADEKSLEGLLRKLWATSPIRNMEWHVRERILGGSNDGDKLKLLENIACKFSQLKQHAESNDIEGTLKLAVEIKKFRGFGPSIITEILYCINPEYPIFNRRTRIGLSELNYNYREYKFTFEEYRKFMNTVLEVSRQYDIIRKDIEHKLNITITRADFLDAVYDLYYDKKFDLNELDSLKIKLTTEDVRLEKVGDECIDLLKESINQVLFFISRGESKDVAIEKGSSYTLWRIHELDLPKETIAITFEIINKLSEKIYKQVK